MWLIQLFLFPKMARKFPKKSQNFHGFYHFVEKKSQNSENAPSPSLIFI